MISVGEKVEIFLQRTKSGLMASFQDQQRIVALLKAALESSIYHAPTEAGLIYEELLEVGSRVGLQPGEIGDAMQQVTTVYLGHRNARLLPNQIDTTLWMHFMHSQEPDYRNPQAFDFVFEQLHASARAYGARNVQLERRVIVERAAESNLSRRDVEVAITIMVLHGTLLDKDGTLSFVAGRESFAAPSAQMEQQVPHMATRRNEALARVHPIVKDVIDRRSDGRPKSIEPLDAFADQLDSLGYGPFRLWWTQIVAEFRQASTQTSPVTVAVLAGSLVEGSLAFVVSHARKLGLGVMGSKTFNENPTRWRIDDLVSSASVGGDSAILDAQTRLRADGLISTRQRIHAGRMLADFPGGPADLRPEEAREARATAEQVVRRVIDWLQKYPTPPV